MSTDASLGELLKELIKALKAFIEAAKLIEDLAVGGFGSQSGERVQTSKNGDYAKGDPKCFGKLRWTKRQLTRWINKIEAQTQVIWMFIEEREDQIR